MDFKEIHSKIYHIATVNRDEDTFMKVIPRTKKRKSIFGNNPKKGALLMNKDLIQKNNTLQLSLFN